MNTTRSMTVSVDGGTKNFPAGTDVSGESPEVQNRLRRAGALDPVPNHTVSDTVIGGTDTIATTGYAEGEDITGQRSDGSGTGNGEGGEGNDDAKDDLPDFDAMTKADLVSYAEANGIELASSDDKAAVLGKVKVASGITA